MWVPTMTILCSTGTDRPRVTTMLCSSRIRGTISFTKQL